MGEGGSDLAHDHVALEERQKVGRLLAHDDAHLRGASAHRAVEVRRKVSRRAALVLWRRRKRVGEHTSYDKSSLTTGVV